ncbi:MAG TPA: hypothetical protein VKM55_00980 [Candidatus Lokiarchaeia archaeon]|nr:hypothetical protein [Candidatus Lokiarchaeia archaeon]
MSNEKEGIIEGEKERREEEEIAEKLRDLLKPIFPDFRILSQEPLIYHIWIVKEGKFINQTFRQDLIIYDESIPLVGMELKINGYNTDKILTSAGKVGKLKNIYPHLQYGLIVIKSERKEPKKGKFPVGIPTKFFEDGAIFDFTLIMPKYSDITQLVEILKIQIKNGRIMNQIFSKFKYNCQFKSFSKIIDVVKSD